MPRQPGDGAALARCVDPLEHDDGAAGGLVAQVALDVQQVQLQAPPLPLVVGAAHPQRGVEVGDTRCGHGVGRLILRPPPGAHLAARRRASTA